MNEKDILKAARERMAEAVEWDRQNRQDALDDLEVAAGRQWPEEIRSAREADGKPCLTLNQLPQFIRQVTGDIRRLNPSIKVLPGDDETSEETAELIEGLIRAIEYECDASSVYERAAESAAACGIGHFRIRTDYVSDHSFDQKIIIESIHNALSVYTDPAARLPTRADANYRFITEMMKMSDFKEQYPNATHNDFEHDGNTDGIEHWREEGHVVVAEYFWREPRKVRLGLLANGQVVENPRPPMAIVRERECTKYKVMWAKVSLNDILEGPIEMPGRHIPIVSVTGEETHVGTEVVRTSVIRHAKDAQRMYNYASSTQTEVVALQPRAPYMVTLKQIAGLERFWQEANSANRPYLPYNPDDKAPPPKRETPPLAAQGLAVEIQKAAADMRATTGIYDAALGERSNEQSGVAIRQRQIESDISTSIYTDNLQKAVEHAGRIIVDLIPHVYDTRRTLMTASTDGGTKLVRVNEPYMETDGLNLYPRTANDLTSGSYNVRVTVGPSYSTQRQEAAEGMMEFARAMPHAAPLIGDLLARALDWPGAEEMAERLKRALPPGVAMDEDPSPEQQMAQMQAMQEQQRQQQIAEMMAQIEMQKTAAEAREATADAARSEAEAVKTGVEAEQMRLEMALQSGALDALLQDRIRAILAGQ